MTTKQIVIQCLEECGYDGLYQDIGDCGCQLSDLMPCDQPGTDCEAAYKIPCPKDDSCGWGGDCEFHMVLEKQTGD